MSDQNSVKFRRSKRPVDSRALDFHSEIVSFAETSLPYDATILASELLVHDRDGVAQMTGRLDDGQARRGVSHGMHVLLRGDFLQRSRLPAGLSSLHLPARTS